MKQKKLYLTIEEEIKLKIFAQNPYIIGEELNKKVKEELDKKLRKEDRRKVRVVR